MLVSHNNPEQNNTTTTIIKNTKRQKNYHDYNNTTGYRYRDKLAIRFDILMYVATMKNKEYATITDIAINTSITHKQLKTLLVDLRQADLLTMEDPPLVGWNRRRKSWGNIVFVVKITPKGLDFLEKVKTIHNDIFPVLKDCYMIKSGKLTL